eukprot:CAMPEP_0114568592 /NCGR_PEP_ID=MMETSP0114-20121206/16145_1 /TAXON_ID=31324 /ORGANISM="Goniomonas sp, Strain m" /LENGTH=105 /DNA_ID=CAMNT_0001755355 /DNA_START=295 /DNA_END=609 /DNA_ORIENTATION=+
MKDGVCRLRNNGRRKLAHVHPPDTSHFNLTDLYISAGLHSNEALFSVRVAALKPRQDNHTRGPGHFHLSLKTKGVLGVCAKSRTTLRVRPAVAVAPWEAAEASSH